MKSKEALKHIENLISNDTYYIDLLEEEIEVINKDLEVLDILKKLFTEYDIDFYLNRTEVTSNKTTISGDLNKEEQKKIEEWLNE